MPRKDILEKATNATCNDRNTTYGEPYDNLGCLVELKAVYDKYAKGKYSPVHDEAIGHVLGKIARIAVGKPGHTDNYIDGAAYLAIAGECQEIHDQLNGLRAPVPGSITPIAHPKTPKTLLDKLGAKVQG